MDLFFFCQRTVLWHQQAETVFRREFNGLVEGVIYIREDHSKVDQSVVQLVHQILGVSAGDMETDIRVFFRETRCRA